MNGAWVEFPRCRMTVREEQGDNVGDERVCGGEAVRGGGVKGEGEVLVAEDEGGCSVGGRVLVLFFVRVGMGCE